MQVAAAENLPVVSAETASAEQTQGKQDTGFGAMLTSKLSAAMKKDGQSGGKRPTAERKTADGGASDETAGTEDDGDAAQQAAAAAGIAASVQMMAAALPGTAATGSGDAAQTAGTQIGEASAVPIQEALPEIPETAEQLIGGVKEKLQASGAEFRQQLAASQTAQAETGQTAVGQIPQTQAPAAQAAPAAGQAAGKTTAPAKAVPAQTVPIEEAPAQTAVSADIPQIQSPAQAPAAAAAENAAQPAASAEAAPAAAAADTRQTFRLQMKKTQTQASAAPEEETSGAQTETKTIPAAGAAEETSRQTADTAGGDKNGADSGEMAADGQKKTTSAHAASDRPAVTFTAVSTARERQTEDLTELSAAVDRAMEQFENDFRGMERDPSSIQIQLEPKELGSITITLASGASGVAAKIQTDNAQAASLISGQVERMIQAMEAKGVRVENVDVVYGQMSQQNFSQSGNNASQYGAERTFQPVVPLFSASAQPDRLDALSTYESAAGHYAREDGVGQSIEYRV